MALLKERRVHERYDHEADIIYAEIGKNDYSNAKLRNSSIGGMYFNADYRLDPGMGVCIKMNRFRAIFTATVVRCAEMDNEGRRRYGVGIRFADLMD